MNFLFSRLIAVAFLSSASVANAQLVLPTDRLLAFEASQPATELPLLPSDSLYQPATQVSHASYSLATSASLETLSRQPMKVGPKTATDPRLGFVARLALDQELANGAFRPFVGVALGQFYGHQAREDWSAGVAAGARYFVQPRTFVRASVDYGWMFSDARSFDSQLGHGTWAWTMALGIAF